MRVLWLSHVVPYPPKAGVLLRAYYLLRGVAREHEVDLVAFIQEPLLRTFYPTLEDALQECRTELEKVCRSVTFLPIQKLQRPQGKALTAAQSLFTSGGYMASWLHSEHARATLQRLAQENTYDVAHFDCVSLASFRSLFGRTPVTLGHHNAESHMMLRRAEKEPSLIRKLYFWQEGLRLRNYERDVAGEFAAHITCSDLDSERLRPTMPSARFHCIPNGVDVEFFMPQGNPERPASLIFVSSMSWYPNVDAVIFLLRDIWPRVRAKLPDVTLDIVGAGAPPAVVELARSNAGVTLHGFVPEIRPIMESAALYVCPIRDGGGTKLKVLDAFSMRKCVIGHPIAFEGIDVTADTNAVLAKTPDEFADRIQALLLDADRRRRIGHAARELVTQRYSFSSIGKQLVAVLENIAAADRTAGRA